MIIDYLLTLLLIYFQSSPAETFDSLSGNLTFYPLLNFMAEVH